MKSRVKRCLLFLVLILNVSSFVWSQQQDRTETERYLESIGMVNVLDLDPSIQVYMMYAFPNNFVGEILYTDLKQPYLHPLAAESLIQAHQYLKEINPAYRFVIYDACRPMSVQQLMWNKVKGTSKFKYVSNPANGGGLHNYGMAVDLTILDEHGKELPMGTAVDHLGYEAHIDQEDALVQSGVLTAEEKRNRELLRAVMRKAGFRTITTEWWHFNRIRRPEARQFYKVIP